MFGEHGLRVYVEPNSDEPSSERLPSFLDHASGPAAVCVDPRNFERGGDLTDLRSLVDSTADAPQFVFQSALMSRIVGQAQKFARSSATVLLTGESGTGKEMIAHLIHHASPRAAQRYVRVNCAALSESLMESELFGHDRGAFTGAVDQRIGRFEWADGGTLLLDEISEIPVRLQAKLLRVLEEEEFERVGSNATRQANVRVIATTNRDLAKEVREGNFRADLYHRLNVLQIELPALRHRREDILPLAAFFLGRFRRESAAADLRDFDSAARRLIHGYDWPGNVRQLRNVVHRACVLSASDWIGCEELPDLTAIAEREPDHPTLLEMSLDEIERWVILKNLQRFDGNKTAAAAHLGVTSRTLANKMKSYRQQGYA